MQKSERKTSGAAGASDTGEAEVVVGAVCDRGLNPRRPVNQDRYLAIPKIGLFAVFDGVGGRKAGEVASQTAADTIQEAFAADSTAPSAERIRRAILFANRDIYELGRTESAYGSMATTVALLHVTDGHQATIAHVGDSRVYRLSDGELLRETIDHTDLDDKLRAGLISLDDARLKEDDHSINRALGVESDVEFELKTIEIRNGDRFLLCTDGVYRHLVDDEIGLILGETSDPQAASEEMKRLVLERGADDNLTAVVVHIGKSKFDEGKRTRSSAIGATIGQDTRDEYTRRGARPRATSAPSGKPGAGDGSGGTSDRIHVELGSNARSGSTADRKTAKTRDPLEGERLAIAPSNSIIYWLLTIVLVLGAFYGGVRSSSFFNKKRAQAQPARDTLDAGRQAFDRQDFTRADQIFSIIVASDSGDARAWYWLGRTQLEQRRFAESARSFERAVEIAPDTTDAYVQAAAAFEALGNRTKASEMLARYGEAARKHSEPGR